MGAVNPGDWANPMIPFKSVYNGYPQMSGFLALNRNSVSKVISDLDIQVMFKDGYLLGITFREIVLNKRAGIELD